MNFSCYLIEEFKKAKDISTDAEVAELLPAMNKGNLSKIKKGLGRYLTEEQAFLISDECGLCKDWVLVNLAEEKSPEIAKPVWSELAKKLTKSINATILVLSLVFCGFGQDNERNTVFS